MVDELKSSARRKVYNLSDRSYHNENPSYIGLSNLMFAVVKHQW